MEKVRLGRTNLMVGRTAFGAIPIQRLSEEAAIKLLNAAFDGGVNFYDTARGYTTSEGRVGKAFANKRDKVIIATKTPASDAASFEENLQTSLSELATYIDIYQFHNPPFCPRPGGADGLYDAALKAKAEGHIRHIGFSSHRLDVAREVVESGLYDTIQFPINQLSTAEELDLLALCEKHDVGFIVMKALSGGLITNAKSSFAFLRQYKNAVPIWGIEHHWQLEELLGYENKPPALDAELLAVIEKDKQELTGNFCRACGYCLPCPAEIPIPMAGRMNLLLGRMNVAGFITEDWQKNMRRINDCNSCGHCEKNCPYGIKVRGLLKDNLEFYEGFLKRG